MATRIQIRRGTASEWAALNPVLAEGEFGFEVDTGILRIGDGKTVYLSLVPIITVGSIHDALAAALETLNTQQNVVVDVVNTSKDDALLAIDDRGQFYTDSCEEIAGRLSSYQSIGAFMFNTIDGGDKNSVFDPNDSIDCGNAASQLDENHILDGDNAKSSQKSRFDVYINIEGLTELQTKIDNTASELSGVKNAITLIQTNVGSLQSAMQIANNNIEDLASAIVDIQDILRDLTQRITNIETTIDCNN